MSVMNLYIAIDLNNRWMNQAIDDLQRRHQQKGQCFCEHRIGVAIRLFAHASPFPVGRALADDLPNLPRVTAAMKQATAEIMLS